MGVKPTDAEISSLLSEIDLTYHGQLELQDYLQVEQWKHLETDQCCYMCCQCRISGERDGVASFKITLKNK